MFKFSAKFRTTLSHPYMVDIPRSSQFELLPDEKFSHVFASFPLGKDFRFG